MRKPTAVVAFGGWNDACDVASATARYIVKSHDATTMFAEIEPDPFYDFQQNRPAIEIRDGVSRSLVWPTVSFTAASRLNDDRDLVIVSGPEPNYRWKTFARSLVEVLDEIGVEEVILVGAYVGATDHRQPVSLSGVGTDPVSVVRSGLEAANYMGPTGIVGAVQGACKEAGIRSISIWAATPPYLGGNPFPKAVLAMVEKISDITNLHIDTSELIAIEAEYTQRVDEALEDAGSDVNDFLEEIESYDEPLLGSLAEAGYAVDIHTPSLDPEHTDELVEEIVKFLEGDS